MSVNGKKRYRLLDSWNTPLANGVLAGPADGELLQIQVLDGRVGVVTAHEVIQVVGSDHEDRAVKCRLTHSRNDMVVLERLETADASLHQNLRIPVCFYSYLYPTGETKRGRMVIRSVDLSCSGIAYYGEPGMQEGDTAEVVLPITEEPLIVRAEILRTTNDLKNGETLYAAKFVDLCHDEETMIRRAVFSIQIRNEN